MCTIPISRVLILIIVSCAFTNSHAQDSYKLDRLLMNYTHEKGGLSLSARDTLLLVRFERDLTEAETLMLRPKKRFSVRDFIVKSNDTTIISAKIVSKTSANSLNKASDNLVAVWNKNAKSSKIWPIKFLFSKHISSVPDYLKKYQHSDSRHEITGFLNLQISMQDLGRILDHKEILFADIVQDPTTEMPVDYSNLSDNESTAIHGLFPEITGKGINLSLKDERFDPNDMDLFGKVLDQNSDNQSQNKHSNEMATLALGSGNSFIKGLGVAPGASIKSSNYKNLFPDDISQLTASKISIQNHSYGVGIENVYGIEARAYDAQIYKADTMMHVFSSGNIGLESPQSGLYANISGYANLTGNFKHSKNVLVVGGISQANSIVPMSSRGPTFDGRIKPELVSSGEAGTSGAAALTSGVVALLQQKYRDVYTDLPPSSLIKSVLVNSADDLGRPQVDYIYGFGKVNAFEAIKTIVENRFKVEEMIQGQDFILPVTVGNDQSEIKVTLAWTDPPAEINCAFSLVNNLDLSLELPNGRTILPWGLSSYPHPDSLNKAAVRKTDDINNVQQISFEKPVPGTYKIHIRGRKIMQGIQKFAVAYQLRQSSNFFWTYPLNNNHLFANQENYVRWNSTFSQTIGRLWISYDDGLSWVILRSNVPLNLQYYKLTLSSAFTRARLKMEIQGKEFMSNSFVISSPPELNIGYSCSESVLFHWKPQSGAIGYTLYNIKDNKLTPITTSLDTMIIVDKNISSSPYFAVAANGTDFTGLKSYTIDYHNQGTGCYLRNFSAGLLHKAVKLNLNIGSTHGLNEILWEKQTGANAFTQMHKENVNSSLFYSFVDDKPKVGIGRYRATLVSATQGNIQTEVISVNFIGPDNFICYPNPTKGELNILHIPNEEFTIVLYNTGGQKIFNRTITGSEKLDLSHLTEGIYICTFFKDGRLIKTNKVIKL